MKMFYTPPYGADYLNVIPASFDCKDPNAWFDKEIYFVAYNNSVGPFFNVQFFVGGTWINVGYWGPGTYVRLDHVKMDADTKVDLYINGQSICAWQNESSRPSIQSLAGNVWHKYKEIKHMLYLDHVRVRLSNEQKQMLKRFMTKAIRL